MIRKRFDKRLYDENDKKTKEWAKKILPKGYEIRENDNKIKVDLIVSKDNVDIFYIEVECKSSWDESKFPYDNLNIPSRKKKYTELDKPTLFIVFNAHGSDYLCLWGSTLIESPLEEVKNRFVSHNEMFYKVPLNKCYSDIKKAIKNK